MTGSSPREMEFLSQLNAIINANLGQEDFGVAELAGAMNMSRSNLLRKVKKATDLSASQLISQARLQRAMELLRTSSMNVTEVSFEVGFNSTSYFIKCFREHFGYPPGEVGKQAAEPVSAVPEIPETPVSPPRSRRAGMLPMAALLLLLPLAGLIYWLRPQSESAAPEKSIVVLPFKNDSADSTNTYLINGLMDATLNNLQKIADLKVLSRTSAEKYRNSKKSIPEMASELKVTYFVEGSGQKLGDRIVLNIQLIDGKTDRHLWSKQYRRETGDIFALQQEISGDIAAEIRAVITPEEKRRIEKIVTEDLEAYDQFMQGLDLLKTGGDENLKTALGYFQQAVELDSTFALAYACAAIACYYLDIYRSEKTHAEALGSYADQALLYDPKLGESFTAKAMYYMLKKEYDQALPFLEKGLEYNPNDTQIIGLLADFYGLYLPNTALYLKYALRGVRLDAVSGDSTALSYFYLRLGNALIQTGFVEESLLYLDRSLGFKPDNPYSRYIRAFALYARDRDLHQTRALLLEEYQKDSSRFDILQDIGKVSYYLREYEAAFRYYEQFNHYRESQKLDVYTHENMIIGVVYEKNGRPEEGQALIESYRRYLDTDPTAYKNLGLAMYYTHSGKPEKALEYFRLFTQEDNIQYWVILFLNDDPILDDIKDQPEIRQVLAEINRKFWRTNEKIKSQLTEELLW